MRVRSAGAGGCGHSEWGQPYTVSVPAEAAANMQPVSRNQNSMTRSASAASVGKEIARQDQAAPSDNEEAKRKTSKLGGIL